MAPAAIRKKDPIPAELINTLIPTACDHVEVHLRKKVLTIFERVLLITGVTLLGYYGAALVDRHWSSRVAMRTFETARASAERIVPDVGAPDFSMWSEKRVKGYRESLLAEIASPLGTLRIDRLHIHVPVFAGTDELSLNRGLGWIAGTAKPGQPGNIGIAGHRDGFFRALKDIALGDVIELSTRSGSALYSVDQTTIVDPADVGVLQARIHPSLTLVTCYPFYFIGSAPQRFIVQAALKQPGVSK